MMNWIDVASIVFVCVTANHLGLIGKLEEIMGELPIIDCPKCFSFWAVLAYSFWSVGFSDIPIILATSFLASYIAIWLELLEAYIDTVYMRIYETITTKHPSDEASADTADGDTNGTLSELQQADKKKTEIKR